jgi:hypothetical protein
LPVFVWFMNESGHRVKVNVKSKNEGTEFPLDRNSLDSAAIEGSSSTAIVRQQDDAVYAKCVLTPPGSERYYDPERHAYYYRIRKNEVEPVLPAKTRHWDFYPMPDRD